jgi:hypothetical protein
MLKFRDAQVASSQVRGCPLRGKCGCLKGFVRLSKTAELVEQRISLGFLLGEPPLGLCGAEPTVSDLSDERRGVFFEATDGSLEVCNVPVGLAQDLCEASVAESEGVVAVDESFNLADE